MDLKKLKEPFKSEDVEWRIQRSGEKGGKVWAMCLAYITSRAVMDRLDEVAGAESWKNEFKEGPHGGVLCGISIKLDSEWVTKWDGADNTDIEAVKGGLSGAMKRAAVLWGIGRYLYDLDVGFANVCDNGKNRAQTKEKKHFKWNPPTLPSWALPTNSPQGTEVKEKVTPKKAEAKKNPTRKPNAEDIKYFGVMTEQKNRLGKAKYYDILAECGYKHCNEVTTREDREVLYRVMSAR